MTPEEARARLQKPYPLSEQELDAVMTAMPGVLRLAPPWSELGVTNSEQAVANLRWLGEQGRKAKDNGFFLEAAACRAYQVELLLRVWTAARGGGPVATSATLGALVKAATDVGYDGQQADHYASLWQRLNLFVTVRNGAVHDLITGDLAADQLGPLILADERLIIDLERFVFSHLPTFESVREEREREQGQT